MAGSAASSNIEGFIYMSMNAFYQAVLSFVSQNTGAGRYERINRILFTGLGCVAVVGLAAGNLAVVFGRQLLSVYSDSGPVIEAGMVRLGVIAGTYAICGMMDVMVGALRGSVIP